MREELRALLDDFCSGFIVSLSLLSRSGKTLLTIPRRLAPPYCRKVHGWMYGPGPCAAQAQRMRHLASDRGDSLLYTCHAGLRYCVHGASKLNVHLSAVSRMGRELHHAQFLQRRNDGSH